ncbi:MAG: hypothetical protein A2622_10640 [Bdellovibrionales bacterium RIFCSPHIGHO2_01_FULL_40_29]|nr:MAG: hypothetical protein A2622_10640 [Bdellovibrionales bacterium RIFCSPHIGHO2_01_FULL_40_29]OFZ34416.1 MAG: hypothetical protein A3D17_00905 [Bdellovibrionales bacterium RIFCSPHIGHO2_02_FULL_40_15]
MLIIEAISKAKSIILSTHKSSDGDGLGSEISMYYALKSLGKNVRFVHSDAIPTRYHFLIEKIPKEAFCSTQDLQSDSVDLALIFDTHDPKLCSPLYEILTKQHIPLFFIDHHVPTEYPVSPTTKMLIDESASCTGEIVFGLIKKLQVPLNPLMASALYASLIFDTQNFKLIRDHQKPFLMASELLASGINYERIQNQMFANWNIEKMNYLSYLVTQVKYYHDNTIAIIKILKTDLERFHLDVEQVSDLVDLFMQIQTLSMAIVIREDSHQFHKMSFRSRHSSEALDWARAFDGGGHALSSGAWVPKTMAEIDLIIKELMTTLTFKKTGTV